MENKKKGSTKYTESDDLLEIIESEHAAYSINTPVKPDAFELDDETKIEMIEKHFEAIMNVLGLDMDDDSLKDTPKRVAKMYVKEVFSGLNSTMKGGMTSPDYALFCCDLVNNIVI